MWNPTRHGTGFVLNWKTTVNCFRSTNRLGRMGVLLVGGLDWVNIFPIFNRERLWQGLWGRLGKSEPVEEIEKRTTS